MNQYVPLIFPIKTCNIYLRGSVTVAHGAHNPEAAGSIPAPATLRRAPSAFGLAQGKHGAEKGAERFG